jgi:PhnB protein
MADDSLPEGYHTVTPTLVVTGAEQLIAFVVSVFGATVRLRSQSTVGGIAYAECLIGDSPIMIADGSERIPAGSAFLHVYVGDTDSVYQTALAAGAISLNAPSDHRYGDRSANVQDPWGNRWTIATRLHER